MTHLVPTLDHVVINVRDRIDEGAETYRKLGFTLTPRGYHTLGSMNHLAMFGTDYLELIAAPPDDPPGTTKRPEILAAPDGLNGLVFGTEDSAATHFAMQRAGVAVFPPEQFSRPVALPEGSRDAVFRTVRLMPGMVPAGRLYFCQHLTRDLVWRDEWRHHANGATGIARAVIVAKDPLDLGELFGRMFGPDSVRPIEGGRALTVGVSRFDVVTPDGFQADFDDASSSGLGRDSYMAALEFRTRSLDTTWSALERGRIAGARRETRRVIVPASSAFGATLAFCL
ncbi:MAG: VOC family protein [Acetobacteraceae bacterium]|nr:VOC family protein [Acetobacteraceae bacterium]